MKIGDRVRPLNETSEGFITRIEGRQIFVELDDFEFPYTKDDLVVIEQSSEQLRKEYARHSPVHKSIKGSDLPPVKPMTQTEKIEELGRVRGKRNSKGILEFDLHIHDLLVKTDHMTPGEMLNYQLDYAVHCLEETIRKREKSLVFIHGIGKGVLRTELHKIIKAYGLSFHDGFMQEYGMGATRVELHNG